MMKQTFTQFLIERIAIPASAMDKSYQFVKDVLSKIDNGEIPERWHTKVQFRTEELPERYRKGIRTQKVHPLTIAVGKYGDSFGAVYTPMGKGTNPMIHVNMDALPEDLDQALELVYNHLEHELQHATQDAVLRKQHSNQFSPPELGPGEEGWSEDEYFASDIEFHPQIITAKGEFVRMLKKLKEHTTINVEQARQLLKAFTTPTERMPEGFLRYKKGWTSDFFASLYRTDKDKWKKAVRELYRHFS